MNYPQSLIDEIKIRVAPSQIIGRKVKLVKSGRTYKGCCPFHNEKTPSFHVDDNKLYYHCFGCSAHGDVISFVSETEGLSFHEAVEQLAKIAGLELPEVQKVDVEKERQRQSLYDIMEMACKWFESNLKSNKGVQALHYLKGRGLNTDSITKFRLGYCPDDWELLKKYLSKNNVSDDEMLRVGLVIKNDNGRIYDRFRGRVIFPITDVKKRVVAFGGRILNEGQPKYLNSPETDLFKKSHILYNENNAKKAAFLDGQLVIVEGYMDVISLDVNGFSASVAPLGTALTESQLLRLWNIVKEPVICLDGDAAGLNAMARVAHFALPLLKPGLSVRFAILEKGSDPDDYIKSKGLDRFKQLIENSMPLSQVLWNIEYNRYQPKTPEQYAGFEKAIMELIAGIEDKTIYTYYKKLYADRIYHLNFRKKKQSVTHGLGLSSSLLNIEDKSLEFILIEIIYNCPELLLYEDVKEEFINIQFSTKKLDKLHQAIIQLCDDFGIKGKSELKTHLNTYDDEDFVPLVVQMNKGHFSYTETIENTLLFWRYNYNIYSLSILKDEFKVIQNELSASSEERAREYMKQIHEMEKNIYNMQIAFAED